MRAIAELLQIYINFFKSIIFDLKFKTVESYHTSELVTLFTNIFYFLKNTDNLKKWTDRTYNFYTPGGSGTDEQLFLLAMLVIFLCVLFIILLIHCWEVFFEFKNKYLNTKKSNYMFYYLSKFFIFAITFIKNSASQLVRNSKILVLPSIIKNIKMLSCNSILHDTLIVLSNFFIKIASSRICELLIMFINLFKLIKATIIIVKNNLQHHIQKILKNSFKIVLDKNFTSTCFLPIILHASNPENSGGGGLAAFVTGLGSAVVIGCAAKVYKNNVHQISNEKDLESIRIYLRQQAEHNKHERAFAPSIKADPRAHITQTEQANNSASYNALVHNTAPADDRAPVAVLAPAPRPLPSVCDNLPQPVVKSKHCTDLTKFLSKSKAPSVKEESCVPSVTNSVSQTITNNNVISSDNEISDTLLNASLAQNIESLENARKFEALERKRNEPDDVKPGLCSNSEISLPKTNIKNSLSSSSSSTLATSDYPELSIEYVENFDLSSIVTEARTTNVDSDIDSVDNGNGADSDEEARSYAISRSVFKKSCDDAYVKYKNSYPENDSVEMNKIHNIPLVDIEAEKAIFSWNNCSHLVSPDTSKIIYDKYYIPMYGRIIPSWIDVESNGILGKILIEEKSKHENILVVTPVSLDRIVESLVDNSKALEVIKAAYSVSPTRRLLQAIDYYCGSNPNEPVFVDQLSRSITSAEATAIIKDAVVDLDNNTAGLISHVGKYVNKNVSVDESKKIAKDCLDNVNDNLDQLDLSFGFFNFLFDKLYPFLDFYYEDIIYSCLFVQSAVNIIFTIFGYVLLAVKTSYHLELLGRWYQFKFFLHKIKTKFFFKSK